MRRRVVFLFLPLIFLSGCKDEYKAPLQTVAAPNGAAAEEPEEQMPPPTAEEKQLATDRLDRAIAAHGGPARLQRLRRHILMLKGLIINVRYGPVECEQEIKLQFPDHLYSSVKALTPEGPQNIKIGWTGESGWVNSSLGNQPIDPALGRNLIEELHIRQLQMLLPLKDPGFVLRPVDGPVVDGKSTVGIKVNRPDRVTTTLYFDTEKHLLVGLFCPRFPEPAKIQQREIVLSGHHDHDGLILPTRIVDTRDGQVWVNLRIEYKFVDGFDPKEFEEPKQ